jgi:hypothetical protein
MCDQHYERSSEPGSCLPSQEIQPRSWGVKGHYFTYLHPELDETNPHPRILFL